jgi:uncharacterized membrane protein YphA (DoxX/SURF4 family)
MVRSTAHFPIITQLRHTQAERFTAAIRIFVGLLIFMTGMMKLFIPSARAAWSGQLLAADLPLYNLTFNTIPFVEVLVGLLLVVGFFARLGALTVGGMMVVASYVHLVVHDPSLFPFQPNAPVVPFMVLALAAVIFWRGAGAASLDLKEARAHKRLT